MKKVLGLAFVLFFIFSLLPANAGPAYERLKTGGLMTVEFYDGYRPLESETRFLFSLFLLDYPFPMETCGFMSYVELRPLFGGRISIKWRRVAPLSKKPISAEEIFSDKSFRETISRKAGRFMQKILNILRIAASGGRCVQELVFDDLRSKGFSEQKLSSLYAILLVLNDPTIEEEFRHRVLNYGN